MWNPSMPHLFPHLAVLLLLLLLLLVVVVVVLNCRLRGVLLNLYTNAAKFTKSGQVQLRVRQVPCHYTPRPPRLQRHHAAAKLPSQQQQQVRAVALDTMQLVECRTSQLKRCQHWVIQHIVWLVAVTGCLSLLLARHCAAFGAEGSGC